MLNRIKRFLFGENDQEKPNKSEISHAPGRSSRTSSSSSAVDSFLYSIGNIGHPKYPVLDHRYSPSSRIPCTDLVPFISDRIIEGDEDSIKSLMRLVIEGNPGLGIGADWIDESIDDILSIPFENYLSFSSGRAFSELKALFIVASKDGGDRRFLITSEIPRFMAWACIAHQPSWTTDLSHLIGEANSWISKMAKDTPYWKGYEEFTLGKIPTRLIDPNIEKRIAVLTPAARLQLFYAIQQNGGSLPDLTNYQIRNLGINVQSTSKELIDSGLMLSSFSTDAIESVFSKRELMEICDHHEISYAKSWRKTKILETINDTDSSVLEKISKTKHLVSPNYKLYPGLKDVVDIADKHQSGFKLLCFSTK